MYLYSTRTLILIEKNNDFFPTIYLNKAFKNHAEVRTCKGVSSVCRPGFQCPYFVSELNRSGKDRTSH